MTTIYLILNTATAKVYVGSTDNLKRRWDQHRSRLRRGVHHSLHMQRAWDRDGEACFALQVIQEGVPQEDLLAREQAWIDIFRASDPERGYNRAPVAGSRRGCRMSQESRAKMSKARTGMKRGPMSKEQRGKLSLAKTGQKHSTETRAKMSEARKGRRLSLETRERISAAHKARRNL